MTLGGLYPLGGALLERHPTLQQLLVRRRDLRGTLVGRQRLSLLRQKLPLDFDGDRLSDLPLQRDDVVERARVVVRPDMRVAGGVNQLNGDPDLAVVPKHRSLDQRVDPELLSDLRRGLRRTHVLLHRSAGDDPEARQLAEACHQRIVHARAEEVLTPALAEVLERKHGKREDGLAGIVADQLHRGRSGGRDERRTRLHGRPHRPPTGHTHRQHGDDEERDPRIDRLDLRLVARARVQVLHPAHALGRELVDPSQYENQGDAQQGERDDELDPRVRTNGEGGQHDLGDLQHDEDHGGIRDADPNDVTAPCLSPKRSESRSLFAHCLPDRVPRPRWNTWAKQNVAAHPNPLPHHLKRSERVRQPLRSPRAHASRERQAPL